MTPNTVPHLCGGILFDLLLEARKPRQKARNKLNGGSDGLTIPGVYVGLIEIVTGDDMSTSAGKTLSKCATNYRKCEDSTGDYVPFTDKSVQVAFKNLYITNMSLLLERTSKFARKYLNKDKCVWLVAALIETMQQDQSVDNDLQIAINYSEAMSVEELHTAKKIVFLPFLLNVLHYVMGNCSDCESGNATFKEWYSQATPKSEWKFNSNIGACIPNIEVDTDFNVPARDVHEDEATAPASGELSDHEVITNAMMNTAKAMASTLGAANHQIAKEIRQKQKKQAPTQEEPEIEHIEAEIVDDEIPSGKETQNVTIIQNQTNIEHDESKSFNIDNSNVTFNL